jgi:hypothetical protein
MTFQFGDGSGDMDTDTSQGVFAGLVRVEVPTSHVANFSSDGKAATLLFDRLYSSVHGQDHTSTTSATFILPVKDGGGKAHVDLRGFVVADDGANASLIVQVGGKAEIVDLEQARDDSSDIQALQQDVQESIAEFRKASSLQEGFLWSKRFEVQIAPESGLAVTTILVTQQSKNSPGAYLVVDSLDAEIEQASVVTSQPSQAR